MILKNKIRKNPFAPMNSVRNPIIKSTYVYIIIIYFGRCLARWLVHIDPLIDLGPHYTCRIYSFLNDATPLQHTYITILCIEFRLSQINVLVIENYNTSYRYKWPGGEWTVYPILYRLAAVNISVQLLHVKHKTGRRTYIGVNGVSNLRRSELEFS